MMQRKELQNLDGQRLRFTATLARACRFAGYPNVRVDSSLTLTDVTQAGLALPQPLPMEDGVWSRTIPSGAQIAFDARLSIVATGRRRGEYKLQRPAPALVRRQPGGEWLPPDKDGPDELAADIDRFLIKRGNKNRRCRGVAQSSLYAPVTQCLRLARPGPRKARKVFCESCQQRNARLGAALPDDIPEGWQPRRFAGATGE